LSELYDIRLIAMYLPQFHPIAENNAWWGEGFTEWTNVRNAHPRFPGHYQPHVPGQLGYYDLRDPASRAAQADLAREHGIHGFCYYHYWFNGRRLLETPFNEVLQSRKPDFPFCVCWANENWTRSWDGLDKEVLMAQHYSNEDSLAFIEALFPAFRDERYIRVNGKPLLLVYRTGLITDVGHTTEIWREAALRAGIGELYLVRVENYMAGTEQKPADIGFDAAMEFAPYWGSVGSSLDSLAEIGGPPIPLRDNMYVFDYAKCMDNMLTRPLPDYPLFRGVFPSWDNSARRRNEPTIFVNSSPEQFTFWLAATILQTVDKRQGDERLVFINAWNEWGEGCHLEPDERFGMAWLEAVRSSQSCGNFYASALEIFSRKGEPSGPPVGWHELFLQNFLRSGQEIPSRELLSLIIPLLQSHYSSRDEVEINRRLIEHSARKDELLTAVTSSLSWRLTAPIRTLLDKVQGK